MNPNSKDLYQKIFELIHHGQIQVAQTQAQKLTQEAPNWAPGYTALAAAAAENGDLILATEAMQQALQYDPSNATYAFNLIQLLRGQNHTEALLSYCEGLTGPESFRTHDGDFYLNIADIYVQQQQLDAAKVWLKATLQAYESTTTMPVLFTNPTLLQHSTTFDLFFNMAKTRSSKAAAWISQYVIACCENQRDTAASPYLETALEYALDTLLPSIYNTLDRLWKHEKHQSCLPYFAALEPYTPRLPLPPHTFYRNWGVAAHRHNQQALFERCYQKAHALAPHALTYKLDQASQFPKVYKSHEELMQYRQRYQDQLNELEQAMNKLPTNKPIPPLMLGYPFGLAYQGLNDKELVSQLGRIAHRAVYNNSPKLHTLPYRPAQTAPFRVGFVSSYFYNHSVFNAYGNIILELAKDPEFSVHVLHMGHKQDYQTKKLEEAAAHFVAESSEQACKTQLQAWQLDVLIYTDIGMDWNSYFLATRRLAPIQGLLSGHPVTSGIPHMDYFFSSGHKDLKDLKQSYSETVIILQDRLSKYPPLPEILPKTNRQLFPEADETTHIYFCPMTLFKVHPDFDVALQGILTHDSYAKIYFVHLPEDPETSIALQQRFSDSLGELSHRIHFMDWMKKTEFQQAIITADVILDTFCFGSGTTNYQILSLNQLIVTLPGPFYRSRITRAFYERLNMLDYTVAHSVEDYIKKAVRIATDVNHRQQLKALLKKNLSRLVNTEPQGVQQLKAEIKRICQTH